MTGPVEIRIVCYEAQYSSHRTSLTAFRLTPGIATYTLTLHATAGGTVEANPPGTAFTEGTTIQLTATPAAGHHFAGWTGDLTGFGNPRSLLMDGNKSVTAHFAANPPPLMDVGINLDGLADWSTAYPFVDVFKEARTWQTRNLDGSGAWNSGLAAYIPTDANGWPTVVPFDPGNGSPTQFVHTVIGANEAGTYTFLYEGTGTLRFNWPGGAWTNLPTGGARSFTFNVNQARGNLWLEIKATDPADYLRNFKIITPGHLATYQAQPFHPLYLERLQPFSTLRFMDWGKMNGSPLVTWAQRTTPSSYTQTRAEGAALEYMVQLCNTLQKAMWLCIPAKADDHYIRQAARLIRDTLDPSLPVYVEYSNETWNSMFSQTTYVQDQGQALGLDPDRWTAGQKYVAYRSAQIWRIFEEEFGAAAPTRLVKVMATQSASIGITNTRLAALNDPAINPTGIMADALAIAPYFGIIYKPADIPPNALAYPTVDEIVTTLSTERIAAVRNNVINQKAAADKQGWALITYEGGQHFVGSNGAENDTNLTVILTSANRDPRMYDRYLEYTDMLKAEGVALHAHFSYCGAWSKWGSWGALEYQDQPVANAPKYAALVDWIAENFDTQPPVITCPANLNVNNDAGQCSATVPPGAATATDNSGTVTATGARSDAQPLNAPYPVGATIITWTAVDGTGNHASCLQTVTVVDAQAPTISCPANIVVTAPVGQNTATVDPGFATAFDNCSSTTVTGARSDRQALNAPYPVGVTTITWTALDGAGNQASCPQTVTVNPAADTQPPTAPTDLRSTGQTATTIALAWNAATDNVGVTGYRVFRNGAQVGATTGTTFTDGGLTRSTRYSYYVKAVDAAGNVSAASNTITVRTKK